MPSFYRSGKPLPSPPSLPESPLSILPQGRATASVNGIDIHYAIEGEGPVVVLVHGLACGRRMWFHQVRALRSRYTVLAYDQRGHGLTSAPNEKAAYSPAYLSRDLAGLLDYLGIERCHLVGFSMGGGSALSLAAARPRRVRSLVLADVGASSENPAATQWLVRRWIALAQSGGMPALAEDMLRSEFFKTYANRNGRSRRHMRALIMATPLRGLESTLTEVLAKRASLFRMRRVLESISISSSPAPTTTFAARRRTCWRTPSRTRGRFASPVSAICRPWKRPRPSTRRSPHFSRKCECLPAASSFREIAS